jgi:hypothetical protein
MLPIFETAIPTRMSDPHFPSTPFFNTSARAQRVAVGPNEQAIVIDDALTDPAAWVEWVSSQPFQTPAHYPYPGIVSAVPKLLESAAQAHFDLEVRSLLGARRTQDANMRFSLVSTPADELQPIQWQCHRDRIAADPTKILFAASVLYLFGDPTLGGTSFYRPRLSPAETDLLVADSQRLPVEDFSRRYGLHPGYMNGSNAYFEQTASIPAAWNRLICYDGSLFHSADVAHNRALSIDPRQGRLTLNAFYTCTRRLGG